jgi:hypothetical protein
LTIGEDQDEAARGGTALDGGDAGPDADPGAEDEARKAPLAAKWGLGGLLLVYAGLGSYCVVSMLGGMGTAGTHPEGVTRSVAAALSQKAGTGSPAASSGESDPSGIAAKEYAARAAQRARAAQAAMPTVEALTAVSATAVGPEGESDGDHPGLASYVIDRHSAIAWITHWYATARFGNLKDGTGLLLDMGKQVTIRQIELALGGSPGFWGASLEIRIGDTPSLASTAPVAEATDVGGWLSKELRSPVTGRYIQIWFTKLPRNSWGTFQEHVYGVSVRGTTYTPPPAATTAPTAHHTVHSRTGHPAVTRSRDSSGDRNGPRHHPVDQGDHTGHGVPTAHSDWGSHSGHAGRAPHGHGGWGGHGGHPESRGHGGHGD